MDVEAILKEIRNRVVAGDVRRHGEAGPVDGSNGSAPQSNQSESLTRVSAHLTVTGRAWDRLPPLSSNRQGAMARLELWLKKKSKPLTRWFTWEQVNFNHAVNEALGDVVEILKAEAHELAAMRAQLTHELHLVRSQAADQTREIQDLGRKHDEALSETQSANTRVTQLLDKLKDDSAVRLEHLLSEHARLQAEHTSLVAEHSQLANQVIELAAQLRAEDQDIQSQQSQEINRRLDELAAELKDEQRVCFRQISLETSEAAVLEERARRGVLTRLEQLERSLKD